MNSHIQTVVVGAGHGGVQVIASLMGGGYTGTLVLMNGESTLPYERPPLSKDYLTAVDTSLPLLRTQAYWDDARADLRCEEKVATVDVAAKKLSTESGTELTFENLVWAAGGRARHLPLQGTNAPNVLSIRDARDTDELRRLSRAGGRGVIIGGGYIGLEVAASLTKLGVAVTVLETMDRVLARVTSPIVSAFYQSLHAARGVTMMLGVEVASIETHNGMATGVCLGSGQELPADFVIVGIGMVPNIEPLVAAGAEASNGVHVDESCQTSLPSVFAIGDCAAQQNPYSASTAPIRLESVPSAVHQAKVVASAILRSSPPSPIVPWFWSNQYETKLQTAGLFAGHDSVVIRGEPKLGKFAVLYLREGKLLAADCVNSPADFAGARRLIAAGADVDPYRLSDVASRLG